jgi:hypothetical protein
MIRTESDSIGINYDENYDGVTVGKSNPDEGAIMYGLNNVYNTCCNSNGSDL